MAYFNDMIDVFGEGDKMLNTCLIRLRVVSVETDERGVGELRCHPLKRHSDDHRRIEPHAELQQ